MSLLDPRAPDHVRADRKLRNESSMWLTTVRKDGQPQSTPIWFLWDGSGFLFYSEPDKPKLANIAANPRVSLHLVGDEDAEDIVTVEGIAALDPSAPPLDQRPDYIVKYERLVEEWPEMTWPVLASQFRMAVRVKPTRIRVVAP